MKFRKQLRILNPEKKRQRRNSFIHCFKRRGIEEAESISRVFPWIESVGRQIRGLDMRKDFLTITVVYGGAERRGK